MGPNVRSQTEKIVDCMNLVMCTLETVSVYYCIYFSGLSTCEHLNNYGVSFPGSGSVLESRMLVLDAS